MLRITHEFDYLNILLKMTPLLYTDHETFIFEYTTAKQSIALENGNAGIELPLISYIFPGEKNVVADGFSRLTKETPLKSFVV